MECTPFELSIGVTTVVLIIAFWLGICFIAGLRALGEKIESARTKS